MKVEDINAVITGGASGLGAATAKRLSLEGARIVIGDLAREADDIITACGGSQFARYVRTDVGDPDQVNHLIEQAIEIFGGVDILFNKKLIIIFTFPFGSGF